MVGVSHQGAHLVGGRRTVAHPISRKRTRSSIEYPGATTGYTSLFRGYSIEVEMHDGSHIILRKLENDYDPTDRAGILCMLEEANRLGELITGLIYINPEQKSLFDFYNLIDEPLNRLGEERIRPSKETIAEINAMMF